MEHRNIVPNGRTFTISPLPVRYTHIVQEITSITEEWCM